MKLILLVEDDPVSQEIIKKSLQNDYDVKCCGSLHEAQALLDTNTLPSLIIIDRVLPDGDGLSLCGLLRNSSHLNDVPIIFLSGKDSESDKVSGLYAGADDYLIKPIGPLELRARVQARLRRLNRSVKFGQLLIESDSQRAFILSQGTDTRVELPLTRLEFKLLALFCESPDRIFSREFLLEKVWGDNLNLSDRVVDTHVSHLRKKLAGSGIASGITIEALRGEGYRIRKDPSSNSQAA